MSIVYCVCMFVFGFSFLFFLCYVFFFFFQAEDGIRDRDVTGVQTCALPISQFAARLPDPASHANCVRVVLVSSAGVARRRSIPERARACMRRWRVESWHRDRKSVV